MFRSLAALSFRFLLFNIVFTFSFSVNAQLCTGSLGDPVVNITFGGSTGTGGNPAVPGYMYTSSSCPNDGFYTVTNSTSSCFGNTWHSVSSDHTGGGSGFMLVNASFTAGDFFVATVSDLCPNTTYEFAAWFVNVMRPAGILPNITFSIETPSGVILKQFGTGDIPQSASPEWKQYGSFFTTPLDNAVIVLRMTNNAPGGIGNDVGLDDITFRPCGAKIDAGIVGNPDTVNICEGNTESFTITADVSAGYLAPLFQWQVSTDEGSSWVNVPGATTNTFDRLPSASSGSYWYRLTVIEAAYAATAACRIASTPVVINVHPKPTVYAGPDRTIITGSTIVIPAEASGENISVEWSPALFINDVTLIRPTVTPVVETTYTLTALSEFGCSRQDDVLIKVVAGIFVPTAFTPNGDTKNDRWEIPFLDPVLEGTVTVFNRYGQVVYHCVNEIVSWDGKLKGMEQASGTYIYMITFKSSRFIMKGTITLIR